MEKIIYLECQRGKIFRIEIVSILFYMIWYIEIIYYIK